VRCKLRIGGVDQHRKLDLRRRDGADVDVARGQRRKRLGPTPAWLRMPLPITETLATSVALSSRA
jgi:hypothetical protein